MSNNSKKGVIFGATEKIGSYLAYHISKRGGEIILQDKTESGLEKLSKRLKKINNKQTFLYCDHSKIENFSKIDLVIARKFKKLDFVISCIGKIDSLRPIGNLNTNEWKNLIDQNLTLNWYILKKTEVFLQKSKKPCLFFFSNEELSRGTPYFNACSVSHGALKTLISIYKKEKEKFNYNIKIIDVDKNELSFLSHVLKKTVESKSQKKTNNLIEEIFQN